MIKFDKKSYKEGQEVHEEVQFPALDTAIVDLYARYFLSDDAAIYEEVKQADGNYVISVKDKSHKIIVQLKSKEPLDILKPQL